MQTDIETERTDAATYIGVLADRLRVHGQALLGMAGLMEAASIEARALSEMAAALEAAGDCLDMMRMDLCPTCRLMEVIERISVVGWKGKAKNPARPAREEVPCRRRRRARRRSTDRG